MYDGEQMPELYFAYVQDGVSSHSLRILEGICFAWRGPYNVGLKRKLLQEGSACVKNTYKNLSLV